MKVCYISYYPKHSYPRQTQFINAIKSGFPNHYIITNSSNGFNGYLSILYKILKLRLNSKIDVFILGFRGNEIFFPVRLITIFKPLIFDNFVPFYQAFHRENKWNLPNVVRCLFGPLVYLYEYLTIRLSQAVLTDTISHKIHLDKLFNIKDKIKPIYLGSDFKNIDVPLTINTPQLFKVFFYGTMQRLHGLPIILEAIKLINNAKFQIEFQIVGGDRDKIQSFIENNNLRNVSYIAWLPFNKLIQEASKSSLCLGGPFGNTPQSNNVITGKTFQFLALGKPVLIGSNNESNRFDFVDKTNCLIIPQASSKELALSIIWAYENKSQLKDIGHKGRKMFTDNFDPEILTRDINQIIASVL